MSLRQQLSENPAIVVVVIVVLLGLAGWRILSSRSRPAVEQGYYYDLDQKKLFTDAVDKAPPFTTAAGQTAVVAAVFSCENCADASSRFVGYLEKYSEELRKGMDGKTVIPPEVAREGHLVRSENDDKWVPSSSAQGQQIVEAIRKRCGDKPPKACQP